ncbi:DUF2059 domain-containing protein [Sphingomonas alpina]|uniref:DUF2059 domain-containing protein n=1 Tax=Sphingomonas alpina TaxID=653931 RepID=A0A7H0LIX9_9SPHN|nr:DUF2059 domain-containing protein [Sphingomonas alpina]QNQ09632.1 DUF2059 domain-containing protein [Sphingomonas alpina]
MIRTATLVVLLASAVSAPLAAQTTPAPTAPAPAPAPAQATPVDPARLTVARALMDQIMPSATRDQMMRSMMAAMMQNMTRSFAQNAELAAAMDKQPGARAVFDRFMERQMARSTEELIANLPGMLDAMARAYARRFTLAQLNDMATFFATPTGQVYLAQAPTIMADPDVGVWMNGLMTRSMQRMPDEVAKLKAEIEALDKKGRH